MDHPIQATSADASDTQDAPCEATPATHPRAHVLAALRRLRPSPFTLEGGCRWIEGDARAPEGPRFCDAPRERGRPYCRAHCLRAYAGLQSISAETMRAALGLEPIEPGAPPQAPEDGAAGRGAPAGHDR